MGTLCNIWMLLSRGVKVFINKHNLFFFVIAYATILFSKNIFFHWEVNRSLLFSSLFTDPFSFFSYYLAKMLIPLFIASLLILIRRIAWTIVLSVIIDIWCIINVVYNKSYDTFIVFEDFSLIGNVDHATVGAISIYLGWWVLFFLFSTMIWVLLCRKVKRNHNSKTRRFNIFLIYNLSLLILATGNNVVIRHIDYFRSGLLMADNSVGEWDSFQFFHEEKSIERCVPFVDLIYRTKNEHLLSFGYVVDQYVREQSILSSIVANVVVLISSDDNKTNNCGNNLPPNLINPIGKDTIPNGNLIILLVESLEDWPLHQDIEGTNYAPNIRSFISREHVLYCPNVRCQTQKGNSGDGQMIVNTGLLPTIGSVACMRYGNNKYPNFAHLFPNSAIINPWPHIWNQDTMTIRYGYQSIIEDENWDDQDVLEKTYDYLRSVSGPTCVLAITISMHSPFDRVECTEQRNTAPPFLNKYLNCLHYTDSCIGDFINKVATDSILSNSTIVITGDHTIFKRSMLKEFQQYSIAQGLSISTLETFCPLIIYSPNIDGNYRIDEVCYQMDIFPTILSCINCEGYYWHGFGLPLLNEENLFHRTISENEAIGFSEMMIRQDYFRFH